MCSPPPHPGGEEFPPDCRSYDDYFARCRPGPRAAETMCGLKRAARDAQGLAEFGRCAGLLAAGREGRGGRRAGGGLARAYLLQVVAGSNCDARWSCSYLTNKLTPRLTHTHLRPPSPPAATGASTPMLASESPFACCALLPLLRTCVCLQQPSTACLLDCNIPASQQLSHTAFTLTHRTSVTCCPQVWHGVNRPVPQPRGARRLPRKLQMLQL